MTEGEKTNKHSHTVHTPSGVPSRDVVAAEQEEEEDEREKVASQSPGDERKFSPFCRILWRITGDKLRRESADSIPARFNRYCKSGWKVCTIKTEPGVISFD